MSLYLPGMQKIIIQQWPEGRAFEDDLGEWSVAYVQPRNEKALACDCERDGVIHFLPLYEKRTRRKDNNKIRKSILPLFTGYFPFSRVEDGKRRILETNRVVRILDVPDQERFIFDLTQIQRAAQEGVEVLGVEPIQPGKTVRILDGALQGMVGVVQETFSTRRLLINVEAFNASVALNLDCDSVEPID